MSRSVLIDTCLIYHINGVCYHIYHVPRSDFTDFIAILKLKSGKFLFDTKGKWEITTPEISTLLFYIIIDIVHGVINAIL